jgi:hypothetical protein
LHAVDGFQLIQARGVSVPHPSKQSNSPREIVLLVAQEKEQKSKDHENLDDFMFPKYPTGPVTGYRHIQVALLCV